MLLAKGLCIACCVGFIFLLLDTMIVHVLELAFHYHLSIYARVVRTSQCDTQVQLFSYAFWSSDVLLLGLHSLAYHMSILFNQSSSPYACAAALLMAVASLLHLNSCANIARSLHSSSSSSLFSVADGLADDAFHIVEVEAKESASSYWAMYSSKITNVPSLTPIILCVSNWPYLSACWRSSPFPVFLWWVLRSCLDALLAFIRCLYFWLINFRRRLTVRFWAFKSL